MALPSAPSKSSTGNLEEDAKLLLHVSSASASPPRRRNQVDDDGDQIRASKKPRLDQTGSDEEEQDQTSGDDTASSQEDGPNEVFAPLSPNFTAGFQQFGFATPAPPPFAQPSDVQRFGLRPEVIGELAMPPPPPPTFFASPLPPPPLVPFSPFTGMPPPPPPPPLVSSSTSSSSSAACSCDPRLFASAPPPPSLSAKAFRVRPRSPGPARPLTMAEMAVAASSAPSPSRPRSRVKPRRRSSSSSSSPPFSNAPSTWKYGKGDSDPRRINPRQWLPRGAVYTSMPAMNGIDMNLYTRLWWSADDTAHYDEVPMQPVEIQVTYVSVPPKSCPSSPVNPLCHVHFVSVPPTAPACYTLDAKSTTGQRIWMSETTTPIREFVVSFIPVPMVFHRLLTPRFPMQRRSGFVVFLDEIIRGSRAAFNGTNNMSIVARFGRHPSYHDKIVHRIGEFLCGPRERSFVVLRMSTIRPGYQGPIDDDKVYRKRHHFAYRRPHSDLDLNEQGLLVCRLHPTPERPNREYKQGYGERALKVSANPNRQAGLLWQICTDPNVLAPRSGVKFLHTRQGQGSHAPGTSVCAFPSTHPMAQPTVSACAVLDMAGCTHPNVAWGNRLAFGPDGVQEYYVAPVATQSSCA